MTRRLAPGAVIAVAEDGAVHFAVGERGLVVGGAGEESVTALVGDGPLDEELEPLARRLIETGVLVERAESAFADGASASSESPARRAESAFTSTPSVFPELLAPRALIAFAGDANACRALALQAGPARVAVLWTGERVFVQPLPAAARPCPECLSRRVRLSHADRCRAEMKILAAADPALGDIDPRLRDLCLEAARATDPGASSQVISLGLRAGDEERHTLLPNPSCTSCGAISAAAARPAEVLEQAAVRHRAALDVLPLGAEEAVARCEASPGVLDSRLGIATLRRSDDFGRWVGEIRDPRGADVFFSRGNGQGPADRVSALAEALERYANFAVRPALANRSLEALGADAIDPREFCLPEPAVFDPAVPSDWCAAISADGGSARWVHRDLVRRRHDRPAIVDETTSGTAAHTALAEAACRGLLELLERDAALTAWYARWPAPRLAFDPGVLAEADRGRLELLASRGWRVVALDLSRVAAAEAPVVAALIEKVRAGDPAPRGTVWATSACASDAAGSLAKCLGDLEATARAEAVLMRNPIPREAGAVRSFVEHRMFYADPARRGALAAWLEPATTRALEQVAALPKGHPKETLFALAGALAASGREPRFVDITPPDVAAATPFVVVKAVCAGLTPLFADERLRRLPAARLREARALLATESDAINPNPHPFM